MRFTKSTSAVAFVLVSIGYANADTSRNLRAYVTAPPADVEEPISRTINETDASEIDIPERINPGRECIVSFQCPGIDNMCGDDGYCTLLDPPARDANEELPFGMCESTADCPVLSCFRAPCNVNVCDLETNTCRLEPAGDDVVPEVLPGMDLEEEIIDPILVEDIEVEEPNEKTLNETNEAGPIEAEMIWNETSDAGLIEADFDPTEPESKTVNETNTEEEVTCGSMLCDAGEVCCNPSCGICTPPGGSCTKQFCVPDSNEQADVPATEEPDTEGTETQEPAPEEAGFWPTAYLGECTCSPEACTVCYQVTNNLGCFEWGCN